MFAFLTSRGARVAAAAAASLFALSVAGSLAISGPAVSDDAVAGMSMTREQTYADIERMFGAVPTFVTQLPDAALAGFWQTEKDLELSESTALPPKVKALISLAVAAQIPCEYCIWADTEAAKRAGATSEEIGEAVAMAALTRQTSTLLNGLQVDMDTFRREMGGEAAGQ